MKKNPFNNIFINKKEMYCLGILFTQLIIVTKIIYKNFLFSYILSFANEYITPNSNLIC